MSSSGQCTLCEHPLDSASDYLRRGSCGHHICMMCAFPLLRCGKSLCTVCPAPVSKANEPTALGNSVLGSDGEQVQFVANDLRAERLSQVSAFNVNAGVYSLLKHPTYISV